MLRDSAFANPLFVQYFIPVSTVYSWTARLNESLCVSFGTEHWAYLAIHHCKWLYTFLFSLDFLFLSVNGQLGIRGGERSHRDSHSSDNTNTGDSLVHHIMVCFLICMTCVPVLVGMRGHMLERKWWLKADRREELNDLESHMYFLRCL